MKIEKTTWGYVIGQESLTFANIELVLTAIDNAIDRNLPGSVSMTLGVMNFVLDRYKDYLDEKILISKDEFGF